MKPQSARQIIPKTIPLVAALVLASCVTAPARQAVYVPVHTPCVKDVPVEPVYEFDKLALDATSGEKVLALARDWTRGRVYEGKIKSILDGCIISNNKLRFQ